MPRKSPTESATLFKVGTKKKGNDGNMWEVKITKAGIKRWTKVKEVKKPKGKSKSKISKGFNFKKSKKIKDVFEFVTDKDLNYMKKILKLSKDKTCDDVVDKLEKEQSNIINVVSKIPQKVVKYFSNYFNIENQELVEKAILNVLQDKYNRLSLFDFDIMSIYKSKWKEWKILTDTSPRELIKIQLDKQPKNKYMKDKVEILLDFYYPFRENYKKYPDKYVKMKNDLMKRFFKSQYFIKLFNNSIEQDVLTFLYQDKKTKDGLIYLPMYIIKLKKNDVKSVKIKGSNIKVKIITKLVKNKKSNYKLPILDITKSKSFTKVFNMDKDYKLKDMVNLHMESFEHYLNSGGLIDQTQFIKKNNIYFGTKTHSYGDVILKKVKSKLN